MSVESQNDFNLKSKNANHCVHTKNIYALLDISSNEESYKKLTKHVESCLQCAEELNQFKLKTQAAQIYIPKVVMDRDLRQSFEREVSELFKVMNLNDRQALKRNVKNGFQIIDSIGLSFIKNLKSKTMIKAYMLGFLIFLSLKFFL